ncbi:DEAD/DEAH box helicase family protein [uncultured Marinobacter sp.]|uniref:DEAD/DEAH box helicase family protein n=1 Tax=uncultured Marinobacter sp. TaxID=187379 RepID=UPI0025833924|nr:DEAD/DEAH box helicase family protein [uncultured Marinobacter sp.]
MANPFDQFDQASEPAPRPAVPEVSAQQEEGPGLASNAMRMAGERSMDLIGNLVQFAGALVESGEQKLTDAMGGFNPGVRLDSVDNLREQGYEPDLALGGFGLDFTGNLDPEETNLNLQGAGQAVEDVSFGYQPNYTIEKALEEPTVENILGAAAENGPAALADMAGLIISAPAYLMSRTQEIAEARVQNNMNNIDKASPELQKAIVDNFAEGTPIPDELQAEAEELALPGWDDYKIAGPAAAASVLVDRFALSKLLPGGKPVTSWRELPGAVGNAMVTEGVTEAIQEGGIEYAGESVGTKRGWQGDQALERAAGGVIVGAPTGGAVRGATGTYELRQNQRLAAEGEPEPLDDTPILDPDTQGLDIPPGLREEDRPQNQAPTDTPAEQTMGLEPRRSEPVDPERQAAADEAVDRMTQGETVENNGGRFRSFSREELGLGPMSDESRPADSSEQGQGETRFGLSDNGTGVFRVPVDQIQVDPKSYQFRSRVDEQGTDDRLSGVTEWDDKRADNLILHRRKDGSLYVADGHHRLELAKRLGQTEINARILDEESEGVDVPGARREAALKNIAQGNGEPLDVAKVFRDSDIDPADVRAEFNLPKSEIVNDGENLAKLGDNVFGMVSAGQLPEKDGAVIGRYFEDSAKQEAAAREFQKFKPSNAYKRELLAKEIQAADFEAEQGEQGGLFGDDPVETSLMKYRLNVLDSLRQELNRDKKLFKSLNDNADRASEAGNQIATEANQEISETSAKTLDLISRVSTTPALNDMVRRATERLYQGETKKDVIRDLKKELLNYEQGKGQESVPVRPSVTGGRPTEAPGAEQRPDQRVPENQDAGGDPGGQPPSAETGPEVDDFDLASQTEEELAEQERKRREAEEAEAKRKRDEENQIRADEQLDDFTLTGSDRPVDVAEAAGQDNLFDQPEPEPEQPPETEQESKPKKPGSLHVKPTHRTFKKVSPFEWRSEDGVIIHKGPQDDKFSVYASQLDFAQGNVFGRPQDTFNMARDYGRDVKVPEPEPETIPESVSEDQVATLAAMPDGATVEADGKTWKKRNGTWEVPDSLRDFGKSDAEMAEMLGDGSEPSSTASGEQPLSAGSPDENPGQGASNAQGQSSQIVDPETESNQPDDDTSDVTEQLMNASLDDIESMLDEELGTKPEENLGEPETAEPDPEPVKTPRKPVAKTDKQKAEAAAKRQRTTVQKRRDTGMLRRTNGQPWKSKAGAMTQARKWNLENTHYPYEMGKGQYVLRQLPELGQETTDLAGWLGDNQTGYLYGFDQGDIDAVKAWTGGSVVNFKEDMDGGAGGSVAITKTGPKPKPGDKVIRVDNPERALQRLKAASMEPNARLAFLDDAYPDLIPQSRSAAEIAKSFGSNVSSAGLNAIDGLTKLFGGPGRLSSGLTFDEDTYAQAKPHFKALLRDVQAAGKDLREFVRLVANSFGAGVKPYLLRFVKDVQDGTINLNDTEETNDVSGGNADLEPDSQQSDTGDGMGQDPVLDESGADGAGDGAPRGGLGQGGVSGQGGAGVPGGRPASGGKRGDQPAHSADGELGAPKRPAGADNAAGSNQADDPGVRSQSDPGSAASSASAESRKQKLDKEARQKAQAATESADLPIEPGNDANIAEHLPMLLPAQQGDVAFFERRLLNNKGHGVLTTNGTGTGKTFSGLGLIKRYQRMGRDNIIIVVPNNKIASDWIGSGKALALDVKQLASTQDNGGSGIVVTTYANFRDNNSLLERTWDLAVFDESHYLHQSDDFEPTQAENMRNALTGHPRGRYEYHVRLHAEEYQQLRDMAEAIKSKSRLRNLDDTMDQMRDDLQRDIERLEQQVETLRKKLEADREREEANRAELWQRNATDTLMLSATPFPYRFSVDSAEGYLFNYDTQEPGESLQYNKGNAREQFFMANFGYRMRYNKLTQPEKGVDLGLMEREFANKLQREGVMRSRMLEVDQDYDRQFYEVESQVGRKVDEGLMWLDKEAEATTDEDLKRGLRELAHLIREKFDYLSRAYFLEAVKAKEMAPVIREHLHMGRKVVVFHDFNKGGSTNPFVMPGLSEETNGRVSADGEGPSSELKAAYQLFVDKRPDLQKLPLSDLVSPRARFATEFPDALFFNGQVPKGERIRNADLFNDDNSGRDLIVVQSDAGREGVSLHDTTGKHQRVLINLGLPSKPIASIQTEGRIYRTFVQSNAIQRYVSTGLSMERWAIASKLAERSGTAENLAMGDQARGLKEAILEAYEMAGEYPPGHDGEGIGGKERDRALIQPLSDFDRAKTYYFGTAKNTKKRDQREGRDYFATPEPLGQKMVEWADVAANERILEPSAGHGAILRWMHEDRDVHYVEPSTDLASKAALRAPHAKYHDGNFEDLALQNKYDAVVMNPPYGQGGSTAWQHVAKAARHLKDGGRIVTLVPQGPAADKAQQRFMESDQAKEIYTAGEILLPSVTFERAGTNVRTKVVILERHTKIDNAPNPFTRSVEYAEDINELFSEIEGMVVPERTRPEPAPGAATGNSNASGESQPQLVTAQTRHAKKGIDLFVAKVQNRIQDYEDFKRVKAVAQEHNGYYSKFAKNGAIPGFQFESEKDRADFLEAAEPIMEEIRQKQQTRLKRGATPLGMRKESVQAVVDRVTEKWKDAPKIHVVQSLSEVPKGLRDYVASQGAERDVEAALHEGEVWILAPRMESARMVESVILHEVIGHFGVKSLMGAQIKPFYNTVYLKMGKSPMAQAIKKAYFDPETNPFDPKKLAHRQLVADELIAHLAERKEHLSLWNRFVAMMRDALRRLGFTLPVGRNDILMILRKAHQAVADGGLVKGLRYDAALRRAWHGSPHQFDRFSLEAIGTGEGAQAYGYGLYFAGSREVAEYYRDALGKDRMDDVGPEDTIDAFFDELLKTSPFPDAIAVGPNRTRMTRGELFEAYMDGDVDVFDFPPAVRQAVEKQFSGNLYEVDIPDDDALLDYDAPLADQPEKVRTGIARVEAQLDVEERMARNDLEAVKAQAEGRKPTEVEKALANEATRKLQRIRDIRSSGAELYEYIKQLVTRAAANPGQYRDHVAQMLEENPQWKDIGNTAFGGADQVASAYLNSQGIPGLRYLDGDSRDAGDGSRNYVIWDDQVVTVQAVNDEIIQAATQLSQAQPVVDVVPKSVDDLAEPIESTSASRLRRRSSEPDREERQESFWKGLATQPIDRMFRVPFDVAGLVDSHGRLKPGVKITEKSEQIIKTWTPQGKGVFSWLNGPLELARNGLIDRYKLSDEYRQTGREAEAYGRKIDMQAMDILKVLEERGVEGDEARVLQDILTGEPVNNERLQALAPEIQRAIDDLGQQAVEYGIISRESFERNRGQYLHRSYLKYEGEFTGLGRFVHNLQRKRNRTIEGDTAKGRGKFVKVKMGDLLNHLPDDWFGLKKQNGKVDRQKLNRQKFVVLEDPGIITDRTEQLFNEQDVDRAQKRRKGRRVYWPASKPVPPKWRDWINHGTFEVRSSVGERVVLWRDWTKEERRNMGEILDARYNIAKTFQLMSQDLAKGKLFHDIAQNGEWFSRDYPQDGGKVLESSRQANLVNLSTHDWVLVPDTSIDKTGGTKRWGALAGGYVRAEIFRDLLELDKMHNPGTWRKIMTQWKLNKTARSPVVHTNNVMSNLVFMDMADVRFTDLFKGIASYRKRDQYWREAQEHGAFEGTFVNEEIRRQVLDPILDELAKQDQQYQADLGGKIEVLSSMANAIWRALKKADRVMVNAYQLEDEIFRMAMYIRRRELGDSALEAAIMAREQFLDYDIRAPWVNAARRTVLPFIAYTYRAIPVIAKSMAHRPWKLAKYATIAYLVEELAFAMAGGDEEEERRTMRDQEQGHTWIGTNRMLRMPYNDEYGNPVYLDIRRWIPAGDVFDMNQGQSAVPMPAPVQFGGPLMLAMEFALNKQAFTGEEIVNRQTDTLSERVSKTASWAYKSWMPSAAYIPGSYYWDKTWRAFEGGRDILGRPYSPVQAIVSSVGVKLQPHDVQLGYAFRAMDLEKEADQIRLQVRQARRDLDRSLIAPEQFEEVRANAMEKLQRLQDKADALQGR